MTDYASPTSSTKRPHRGVLILILGIISIVLTCFPLGIVAWVMGSSDINAMDRGEIDPDGRGMTQAGKILGMISVGLFVLGLILFGVLMVLGVAIGSQGY